MKEGCGNKEIDGETGAGDGVLACRKRMPLTGGADRGRKKDAPEGASFAGGKENQAAAFLRPKMALRTNRVTSMRTMATGKAACQFFRNGATR